MKARANIPLIKRLERYGEKLLDRAEGDAEMPMGEHIALLTAMGKIAGLREAEDDERSRRAEGIEYYREAIAQNGAGGGSKRRDRRGATPAGG